MHDTWKSEKAVVEMCQHYMWLWNHKELIEKEWNYPTNEKPYKKKGEGVLKVPNGRPQTVNSVDSDDAKEIIIV
jgi:hypothetical protein